jgi:TetR/AcrR family transcriptional regulator
MGPQTQESGQNIAQSKDRILHAAEKIFARKGYDGARVDEIAAMAEVNKALIYYYFESKEEILHALIHHVVDDLLSNLDSPDVLIEKSLKSSGAMKDFFNLFLKFIEEHKDLFTIIMMELLKESEHKSLILGQLIKEIQIIIGVFRKFGINESEAQLVITEFFTGLIPVIMFVLLKEPWKKLSETKEEEFRAMFLKALELTHIRYTFDLFGIEMKKQGES